MVRPPAGAGGRGLSSAAGEGRGRLRAILLKGHGGMENLVLDEDRPEPRAGAGQAVVAVKACALNYHDIFTRRGMPGIKVPLPVVPGLDMAGEIAALGAGTAGWAVGDRVLVDPIDPVRKGLMGEMLDGGLAEYCTVSAAQLIRMPAGVSFADAAALPVAYGTAHRMMLVNGDVGRGEKVLILGASGGVGTCCVLLAKMKGAEVVACASSPAKLEALRALGADHVVDYTRTDFVKWVFETYGKPHRRGHEGGVDVVVNYTGGDSWVKSLRCLRRGGRMLTCGATAGFDPPTDIRYIWTFELKILGSNSWEQADLERLLAMIAAGELAPAIDRVVPLDGTMAALRAIEEREVFGKVIVDPTR